MQSVKLHPVIRFAATSLLAILVVASPAAAFAPAQAHSTQASQGTFTISDNVDLVLLDVSVKNPHGGFVTGLKKDDFQVFEDGRRRSITQFATTDAPVTIGLVVDDSGSMRFKRPEVTMAGLAFAKESNPKDDFFVVNFNNYVINGLPEPIMFTDNMQQLRAALYYGEPVGQTALYDAVAYALKHLEYSPLENRTLIVVSDGGDNVSKISFSELLRLIEASRATIYTVGLYDPDATDLNPSVLRKMAAISGGEYFEPRKLDEVLPVFNKIAQDIRNCYTIGFTPDETNDKRAVRSVRVIAQENGRKLIVHTRTSYSTTPLSQLLARDAQNALLGRK